MLFCGDGWQFARSSSLGVNIHCNAFGRAKICDGHPACRVVIFTDATTSALEIRAGAARAIRRYNLNFTHPRKWEV